jgi:hypothetical protein
MASKCAEKSMFGTIVFQQSLVTCCDFDAMPENQHLHQVTTPRV